MPEESPKTLEQNQKRKLSKTERYGLIGAILALLAALVNGPIARYSADKALGKVLPKIGMSGTYEITGSIHNGFILKNVNLKGNRGVEKITANNLILEYKLSEIIKGKIRGLTGDNIDLVFAIDEFPKKKSQNKPKEKRNANARLTRSLRIIGNILRQPNMEFNRIDASLKRKGKEFISFHADSFVHKPGSDIFEVKQFQTKSFGNKETPIQDLILNWSLDKAEIRDAYLLPHVYLNSLNLFTEENTPCLYSSSAKIFDSDVFITWVAKKSIKLIIQGEPLDLKKAVAIWDPEIPIGGILNEGAISLRNYRDPLSKWNADIALNVDQFSSGERTWPDARFVAEFRNGVVKHRSLLFEKEHKIRLLAESDFSKAEHWLGNPWWNDMPHKIQLESNNIHFALDTFTPNPEKLKQTTPNSSAAFVGKLITSSEQGVKDALLGYDFRNLLVNDRALPDTKGFLHFRDKKLRLQAAPSKLKKEEHFVIDSELDFDKFSYTSDIFIDLGNPKILLDYLEGYQLSPPIIDGPLIKLSAKGLLRENKHSGKFEKLQFTFQKGETPPVAFNAIGSYDLPTEINIQNASFQAKDSKLQTKAAWSNSILTIHELQFFDTSGKALEASGNIPLPSGVATEAELLKITKPIDFTVWANQLSLQRITDLLPIQQPEGINATINSEINLTGTYSKPQLNGSLLIKELTLPSSVEIPPLDILTSFTTNSGTLILEGKATTESSKILDINGSCPFKPYRWIKGEKPFIHEPVDLLLSSSDFPLTQLEPIFPFLKAVDGTADAKLTIGDTFAEPSINGVLDLNIKELNLDNEYFSSLQDSTISIEFNGKEIIIPKSTVNSSGGNFQVSGKVGLDDINNPNLDLNLAVFQALVHRDDQVTMRADGNISLKGALRAATLSGDVGIVESVFYKDIEIIPSGIPRQTVPKPELPSTTSSSILSSGRLPVPETLRDWKLDLHLKLKDPLLIRGNIADGNITGAVKISGTLERPKTDGTLYIRDLLAELPFSELFIKKGRIYTSNDSGLNPQLDIRGRSKIGQYEVSLFVYGSSDNPQIAVSSNPPLPENEIYTLLATGTTSTDLTEEGVASGKAFQLLIREFQTRAKRQGSSSALRLFANALSNFDLRVGERANLSGRVFSSAALRLHDRWLISASVDRDGDSRGLLVFSLRFH